MEKTRLDSVADAYSKRYSDILNKIWPTMGSNGFNEHNQTVNFMIAYETVAKKNNEQISTWYEFQISNGKKRNNRIDGLIINHTTKELYLIESKRFYLNNMNDTRHQLGNDFVRIEKLDLNSRFDDEGLFNNNESIAEYKVFGILLFDLWTETKAQKDLLKEWKDVCKSPSSKSLFDFFDSFDIKIERDDRDLLPIEKEVRCDRWENDKYSYYLGTLIWKKSNKE